MVVNNSRTESAKADVWVRGRRPDLLRVGWMGEEAAVPGGDASGAERGEDHVVVRPRLAPGQMELYRMVKGSPA